MSRLAVQVGDLSLPNPILLASGTANYGLELADMLDIRQVAGIVGKTITVNPRIGNPPPRVVETSAGMLNTIGLQNPGLDEFERELLPKLAQLPTRFIASVAGYSPKEWETILERFDKMEGVAALEMNLSCPNVKTGLVVGTSPEAIYKLLVKARELTDKPLWAKLTPNVTDIASLAKAAEEGGACGLAVTNTFLGMAVDWKTRRSKVSAVMAGLSGPAIKPLSLRCVYQVAQAVDIPVVGIGGISSARDVLEYMVVGAQAVQIGTYNYLDPFFLTRVCDELEELLERDGVDHIGDLVGTFVEGAEGGR